MNTLKKLCLEILAKCLSEEEDISIKQIPQTQCAELFQILTTRKQLSKHALSTFARDCEFLLHLDVSKSSLIINQSLNLIGAIESLVSLNLSGCRSFASSTLSCIKGLPCLAILDLSKTKIDDYALLDIKTLPSLRTLNLSDTPITDSGIRLFVSSPVAHKTGSNVILDSQEDELPSPLNYFPKLEQLNLTRTLISDSAIEMLSETHLTETLQDIQLVGISKLSTKCARFLTKFKRLRSVNLQATSFMLYGTKTLQKMFAQQPENKNVQVNGVLEIKITKKDPAPIPVAEDPGLPNSNSLWDMIAIKTFIEAPSQDCRKRNVRVQELSTDMDLDSMFHTPTSFRSPVKNKAPQPKPRIPLANITNICSPSVSISLFQTFSPQLGELTPLTSKTKSFTKQSAFTTSWEEPSTTNSHSTSSSIPSKSTPFISRIRPLVETPYKTPTSKTQPKPSNKNIADVFDFDSDDDMDNFSPSKHENEFITDAELESDGTDDGEIVSRTSIASSPSVVVELLDEEIFVDVESLESDDDLPQTPTQDSFIAEPLPSPVTLLGSNKKRPQPVTEICSDLSPSGSCDELEGKPMKKKRTVGGSHFLRAESGQIPSKSRNELLKEAEDCALQRLLQQSMS